MKEKYEKIRYSNGRVDIKYHRYKTKLSEDR